MFPKFANKGAAPSPPRMPAAPAAPAASMARAASATPLAAPATPMAAPARPSASPAPAAPQAPVPRPAAPLAQNLQAAVGNPPARVAGQGFPAFIARGAAAPATPPPAPTSPAHLNHLAHSLKSALPAPSAPARLPMPPSRPVLPQPAAPPQAPKVPVLAGLRSSLPTPQPQLPSMGAARAAQPQKLVAMKSFRDRLARAQANAAQARNAVVLKPAVGQSNALPPSAGASRPAHRSEPPRAEGPGPAAKLLAVPASRPEPKPMSEGRPAHARAAGASPLVAFKPPTPAAPAARLLAPTMATGPSTTSPAQARPTQEVPARVEARSEEPSAPAQTRPPLSAGSVPAPAAPLPQAPVGANLPTAAGAAPMPTRSEDTPRSGTDSSKQSSQKVAALESASARPLLREEMLREAVLPLRPQEPQTAPSRNSGEGEGQGGGSGQGGGGHHQGGSGGGSGGQGRGQSGEQTTLELDWLGGGDELLAFSSDLRELQGLPRSRRSDELEKMQLGPVRREDEQSSEQEQSPPRHQRRRQWEESEEEAAPQVPEDRSDCSPAPLVWRADAEFVAEACRWLDRPEIRHYTVVCLLESGSLGIFRLRDFARFESGHLRIVG